MKQRQYTEWMERLAGPGTSCIGNVSTIEEFAELLHIFHPSLADEWNALNHWEKLRLIEFIVQGSAKISARSRNDCHT
jgi:hypothetical protein